MEGVKSGKGPMTVAALKDMIKRFQKTYSLEDCLSSWRPQTLVAVVNEAEQTSTHNRHIRHMVNIVHVQFHDELQFLMDVCSDRCVAIWKCVAMCLLGPFSRDIHIKFNMCNI